MRVFWLALLAAIGLCSPAQAEDDAPHFKACDGYETPTRRGDGMITGSAFLGLMQSRVDIRREDIAVLSQNGVKACETALADPLLKPEFNARRASLMQARSLHQISLLQFDAALVTLHEVDRLREVLGGKLYDRGIGLGNRLLRAFVFIESDRHGEAVAELNAIEDERPYSVTVRNLSRKLRQKLDPSLDNEFEILRREAPINPQAAISAFFAAIQYARFDDATEFGAATVFDVPRERGAWRIDGADRARYPLIELRGEFAGALAYAYVAVGKPEEAERIIAVARSELAIANAPPPEPERGRKQKKSVIADYEERHSFALRGYQAIDRWKSLIALREELPGLDFGDVYAKLADYPQGGVPVFLDILANAGKEPEGIRAASVSALLEQMKGAREAELELDIFNLAGLLPRPETEHNQVRLKKNGGIFSADAGFNIDRVEGKEGDIAASFVDGIASAATVEEFALLAAAEYAKREGFDSILLQSRNLIERTMRNYGMWGIYANTTNAGREAQARIRLVHRAELPIDLVDAEWRLLDVDTLLLRLSGLPQR